MGAICRLRAVKAERKVDIALGRTKVGLTLFFRPYMDCCMESITLDKVASHWLHTGDPIPIQNLLSLKHRAVFSDVTGLP